MKIKFLSAVAALAVAGAAQSAYADTAPTPEFTVTGSAAFVTDYKFRGISQTDSRPTGQASITITDKSGFYVSAWGSGNSFNDGSEIDIYGGYSHTFKNGITLDGGVYGYLYPNYSADNSYELYVDASKAFGPVGVKVGLNYAPAQPYFTSYENELAHYNMYEYAELTFTPATMPALTLHGHIGHTGGGFDIGKSYEDFAVGVGYKWKNLTFDVSGVGTDVSTENAGSYYRHLARSTAVFSITASF